MRDRIVYFGDFKNAKKQELFAKAAASLSKSRGEKFYYMLPNGSLLKQYREDFIGEVKSSFDINLFTFDDIVNTTLENSSYHPIDNIWKSFIISQILEKLAREGKIPYYSNVSSKVGFVESVNFIIGEIKRSIVGPEQYLDRCPDTPEYNEIGLIYREYESYIEKENLIDREGSYSKALEILKEGRDIFSGIEYAIIDEFYDFRPIELEILKMMAKSDMHIYINIPFQMEYGTSIIGSTISTLKELGFDIEIVGGKSENLFSDIGRNFFYSDAGKLKYSDKISLVESPSIHLELKKVFSEIKRIHNKGVPFREIGIVTLSDEYREEMIEVSIEEELPLSIGLKLNLIKVPFVRELLKALEGNYSGEDRTVKVRKKDTFKNYHQTLVDLIEVKEIQKKIKDTYSELEDFELYKRDILAFDGLLEVLSGMDKIEVWEEFIHFEDYFNLLVEYLKDREIYIKHENENGIKVMDPVNARGFELDRLFIVGISQNQYPILKASNFFLRDENKAAIERIGIDYWDYGDRLDNEAIKFANLIAMAGEKLYLSYSIGDQGIPSIFLDEVLDRFEGREVDGKVDFMKLELDYIFKNNLQEVSTNDELINYLLLNMDSGRLESGGKGYFDFYSSLEPGKLKRMNQKIIGEYQRAQTELDEYSGNISDASIVEDIVEIHRGKSYSPTYLESYSRCPFAFLMGHILCIDELDIEDKPYNPMDIGSIYHEVLKKYYSSYRRDIVGHVEGRGEFNIDGTLNHLEELIVGEARGIKLDVEGKSSTLVLENIYSHLEEYIRKDISRMRTGKEKSIPIDFEVEFGKNGDFSIEVGGRKIKLTGKIDRIDKILNEGKFILIDYKSGSSGIYGIDSMVEGKSLQLPIYMLSQEGRNVVLCMYGQVKKSKFISKVGLIDQTSLITKRSSGAISTCGRDELLDTTRQNILDIVKNIEKANFSLNPRECSSYCIYKNICRYGNLMEVE